MFSPLIVLLSFSLIVLVHEWGHYLAARAAGVQVLSFNIGFGPAVFQKNIKGTKFSFNLFPLGGFVQLAGLDESVKAAVPARARFDRQCLWRRFSIIGAGSFLNILFAILVFIAIYSFFGMPSGVSSEIDIVQSNSPAAAAGLKKGDLLLVVNGQKKEIIALIDDIHKSKPGVELQVEIKTGEKLQIKKIAPQKDEKSGFSYIGISLKPQNYQRVGFFKAIFLGLREAFLVFKFFILGLQELFFDFQVEKMSGPVGIFNEFNQALIYGWLAYLSFFGLFNLYIGFFNLLPLPALDGGRLFFLFLELIFRRPINKELEKYVHIIGFMILLALILFITYYDIQRLLG